MCRQEFNGRVLTQEKFSVITGRKHRVVTGLLVLVFGVFNIGLPIVVASCPMARDTQSPPCFACPDPYGDGTLSFAPVIDYSCCRTVLLAERNTTEFVAVKAFVSDVKMMISLLSERDQVYSQPHSFISFLLLSDPSPPWSADIPVFTSSLLI